MRFRYTVVVDWNQEWAGSIAATAEISAVAVRIESANHEDFTGLFLTLVKRSIGSRRLPQELDGADSGTADRRMAAAAGKIPACARRSSRGGSKKW
jgi:hypothetical protein